MIFEEIEFLEDTVYKNDDGFETVWRRETKKIPVVIKSVTQQEFFKGFENGLKNVFVAETFKNNYNGETSVKYNGKIYFIYRTFLKNSNTIELYLSENKINEPSY